MDSDREMYLRYPGICSVCGQPIPKGALAIFIPSTKTVRHIDCESVVQAPVELNRGVAGASAMREYERREAT